MEIETEEDASAPRRIGVVGAGTMGAGIAQLGCTAGITTKLYDPLDGALERGASAVRAGLDRMLERGKLDEAERAAAGRLLVEVDGLQGLADCELVVEAGPESLELKRELFASLAEVVAADCVLATNTSSLLVTAIAAGVRGPERVVGMHFFNPAPVMALVEVIAGQQSREPALEKARATGRAMGKRVIDAADGPGFLVNRCNRPFGLEALRLLTERVASVELVDQICRQEGGFRMGPFELMDLVGIDVGLAVARSFYEQSFGEPRWRPSPISARLVAAGANGRKSGRGFYEYAPGRPYREDDPVPPDADPGPGADPLRVFLRGSLPVAKELRRLVGAAPALELVDAESDAELLVDADPGSAPIRSGAPRLVLCAAGSLHTLDPRGTAAGFHVLCPLREGSLVELTRAAGTSEAVVGASERFFRRLGRTTVWVGDAPGLVLGRIVSQVVNEAAFALQEQVGSADDIDAGMRLGLNYPRGPFAWARETGIEHLVAVLDGLYSELGDDRYRVAPLLRRSASQSSG